MRSRGSSASTMLVAMAALAVTHAASATEPDNAHAQEGQRIFSERIAPVLTHPRCLNCHTRVDFPRQGDDRHRHTLLVGRGPQDNGAPGLRCSTCHQASNQDASGVPGAPNWHLAPLAMAWENLSAGELCRALKDPAKNGARDLEALLHHMSSDALVLWGWQPGAWRQPVAIPHGEFVTALSRWAELGGPCPE